MVIIPYFSFIYNFLINIIYIYIFIIFIPILSWRRVAKRDIQFFFIYFSNIVFRIMIRSNVNFFKFIKSAIITTGNTIISNTVHI